MNVEIIKIGWNGNLTDSESGWDHTSTLVASTSDEKEDVFCAMSSVRTPPNEPDPITSELFELHPDMMEEKLEQAVQDHDEFNTIPDQIWRDLGKDRGSLAVIDTISEDSEKGPYQTLMSMLSEYGPEQPEIRSLFKVEK